MPLSDFVRQIAGLQDGQGKTTCTVTQIHLVEYRIAKYCSADYLIVLCGLIQCNVSISGSPCTFVKESLFHTHTREEEEKRAFCAAVLMLK